MRHLAIPGRSTVGPAGYAVGSCIPHGPNLCRKLAISYSIVSPDLHFIQSQHHMTLFPAYNNLSPVASKRIAAIASLSLTPTFRCSRCLRPFWETPSGVRHVGDEQDMTHVPRYVSPIRGILRSRLATGQSARDRGSNMNHQLGCEVVVLT